jgi:hypothetical protein
MINAVVAPIVAALASATTVLGGFTPSDPAIGEASGMVVSQAHADTVWIVNDSGDSARMFAVNTVDGHTEGVVTLTGARNVDWEALAISAGRTPARLYVGDIGDNDAQRSSVQVYVLPEPQQVSGATAVSDWAEYELTYPDGAHDAETLLVQPGTDRLFVVTKGLLGGAVYQAPARLSADGPNQLTRIGAAPLLVTDGAFRSDGSVVLRNYLSGFLRADVTARTRPFALPKQRQGETLAVIGDGREAYVGSEGVAQEIYRVALPPLAATSAAPSGSPSPSSTTPPGPPPATRSTAATATGGLVLIGLVGLTWGVVALRRRKRQRMRSTR